jgi:predicted acylesterase/phospholipase RssA
VATSLTDGGERWFTYGPAAEAVLASSAVPAIFPPVEIDGERYIDGGVVNNVPIRRAIDSGATRIVVLLCAPPVYTPASPKRPVEAMFNALMISIHARFARDMAQLPPGVEVIVCTGSEGATRDFDDFSTTEALIAQGREEAEEVVRRYGLGRPGATEASASPPPTSAAPSPTPSPTSAPTSEPAPDAGSAVGPGTSPARRGDDAVVAAGTDPSGGAPSTQPEPGT